MAPGLTISIIAMNRTKADKTVANILKPILALLFAHEIIMNVVARNEVMQTTTNQWVGTNAEIGGIGLHGSWLLIQH